MIDGDQDQQRGGAAYQDVGTKSGGSAVVTALKAYDATGEQGKDEPRGYSDKLFIHLNRPIGKNIKRGLGCGFAAGGRIRA